MSEVTGIILAGGVSRRLGYINKALLKIGDQSIIEHTIEALSEVTKSILLITNSPGEFEHLGLPMFGDIIPDSGSLGGIYTGLKVSGTHYNIVVACDMPFIQSDLLAFLISHSEGYDVAIPVTPDGHHPTCAVYSRNCIEPIESQIKIHNLRIADSFLDVKVNRIDLKASYPRYSPNMLFNVNTNEDYLMAVSLAERHAEKHDCSPENTRL